MSNKNVNVIKVDKYSLINQIIAVTVVNLGTVSYASAIGWLSPVLNEITSEGSPLGAPMTQAEVAFAGGIYCLGGLAGLHMFTIVASKYGRKAGAYCIGLPLAIGLLFKVCAGSVMMMLFGRFLCGFGAGGGMSLPTLLVGECCTPHIRGLLAALLPLYYCIGLIITYVLGAYLPFRVFTAVLMTIPIIYLISYKFIPETPVFLLKIGKEKKAAEAISWYRRIPVDSGGVRAELLRISRQLRGAEPRDINFEPTNEELANELEWIQSQKTEDKQNMLSKHSEIPLDDRPSPWKLLITCPVARKGLLLCLFLAFAQIMMGMFALDSYSAVIFEKTETGLSPDACAFIYAGTLLVGTSIGSLLVDHLGRRPLQICLSVVVCIGQGILGWCFQEPSAPKWLPFIGLFLSVFAFNSGPGIMNFVIASEVLANEVRDAATSIIMGSLWFWGYLLLHIFPLAVEAFEIHRVFYFFSVVSLICAIVCWFILPETKGYSQEEILRKLGSLKPTKNTIENEETIEMAIKSNDFISNQKEQILILTY